MTKRVCSARSRLAPHLARHRYIVRCEGPESLSCSSGRRCFHGSMVGFQQDFLANRGGLRETLPAVKQSTRLRSYQNMYTTNRRRFAPKVVCCFHHVPTKQQRQSSLSCGVKKKDEKVIWRTAFSRGLSTEFTVDTRGRNRHLEAS